MNDDQTRVCVARSDKTVNDGQPEFWCVTTLGKLQYVLNLPYKEAIVRVRRELKDGESVSMIFDPVNKNVVWAIQLDPMAEYGPGYRRMLERLGPSNAEALRLDTIERQEKAREAVSGERIVERDRDTYRDYPTPTAQFKKAKRRH